MDKILKLKAAWTAKLNEAREALNAETPDMEAATRLRDEANAIKAEVDALQAAEALRASVNSDMELANALQPMTFDTGGRGADDLEAQRLAAQRGAAPVPTYARAGRITAFAGADAEKRAYRFGKFMCAVLGHAGSREYCGKNGIQLLANGEATNAGGGVLVPHEFGNDLIDLREQYGVFRRNAKIEPMSSETKSVPRRVGGLEAYFVGEGASITESDKDWDNIQLTAKKLAALVKYSTELSEDAIISIGNDLAEEISYAFAKKEDACGFIGDGTSTYGRIVGATNALKNLDSTIGNIAGLKVGAGNAYSELTLNDFIGTAALLPEYADDASAKWYVHRAFYYNVMLRVALAAGGVPAEEIRAGLRQPKFLGYPVEITQTMPKTEANSQVCALFGDLRRAAKLGDRREVTIATSEHAAFATDQLTVRGTERIDINVHDVGNASATAALREPGPMVGLITAAS